MGLELYKLLHTQAADFYRQFRLLEKVHKKSALLEKPNDEKRHLCQTRTGLQLHRLNIYLSLIYL